MVVAHPDDDILWMGSVIDKVGGIIFCFQDDVGNPQMGSARKKTISTYPLQNVHTLGITEPQAWDKANWSQPEATRYGIKLEKCRDSESRYRETFDKLLQILRGRVADKKNVFTHNPWGEYGHEEHVLVYRVLKTLQTDFHYNLWYSNYCSNRSANFMSHYISGFGAEYKCLQVNLSLVKEIAEIYKKNGCWTWYADYQWFEQECLMMEAFCSTISVLLPYGHNFPVNYIKIDIESEVPSRHHMIGAIIKFLRYI